MKENVFNKTNCKHKLNKNFSEIAKEENPNPQPPKSKIKLVITYIHTYSLLLIYKMTTEKKLCSLDAISAVNLLESSKIYI